MSTTPFKPITREEAAEILSVSSGTLDAMIEDGVLSRPRQLGDCRRLYWHPDVFYEHLHRLLCVDSAPLGLPAPEPKPAKPTRAPRRTRRGVASEAAPTSSKAATTAPPNARGYRDARTRQTARLEELNR
jgi:excisionase family DNA binding protein